MIKDDYDQINWWIPYLRQAFVKIGLQGLHFTFQLTLGHRQRCVRCGQFVL